MSAEPVAPIKSDLELAEETVAKLEAHCNREIKNLGKWTANQSYESERGPLKDLKEARAKLRRLQAASKKKETP